MKTSVRIQKEGEKLRVIWKCRHDDGTIERKDALVDDAAQVNALLREWNETALLVNSGLD